MQSINQNDDRVFRRIGKELGLPTSRVRRIYFTALAKIRLYLAKQGKIRADLEDGLDTLDGLQHSAESVKHSTR